jgi:succinate-semialdehyde dehydrogenase / glutarate-semialdehyde dehydrogenase
MKLKSVDPATEETLREYDAHAPGEVSRRLDASASAFARWSGLGMADRCSRLRGVAGLLRAQRTELSTWITREMGKPLVQSETEIDKCAWVLEHYAAHAPDLLAPAAVETDARESFVRFDPLGSLLAIMPWNFPFWQVFRCAAPALAAGNTVVLKHAANVTGCALAIERLFAESGFEPGVFTTLLLSSDRAEALIGDDRIAAVTLTGSVRAGTRIAAVAGAHLKKTVLELGGSDPFIVLADADLDAAVQGAVTSRTLSSGQSCIAAKRFLVERAIHERFTEMLVEQVRRLNVGDPLDRGTDVGPLARGDLRETLAGQVAASVGAGARCRVGGEAPRRAGFFYDVTVLDRVAPGMPAFDEETFGPVAAVTEVADLEDAIRLANRSRYGLGASLWTADLDRARDASRRLEAGMVFVNGIVKSDPRLPFGGVKHSGYGRELGMWGVQEFVNVKSVWVG